MNAQQRCPDEHCLVSLLDCELPEPRQQEVTEHVNSCDTCLQRLDALVTHGLREDLHFENIGEYLRQGAKEDTLSRDARQRLATALSQQTPDLQARSTNLALEFLDSSERANSLGRLGQYEITEVIGRGGMGIVLKGRDTRLDRVVAVKVLAPELASNPTARKRFLREAQAAAAVSHDHVITTYAVEPGDLPYIAMEYIDGQSLQQKLDHDGPLELRETLRIGMQTAYGLAAAHAQGLIHRDIKPSNILLQNSVERVQITDFGLARAVDDVTITRTGEVTGTPQYMSPEQAQGLPVDHRTDLFSLGCVLYAMCSGRSPFRAESTMAVLNRVCNESPRPISAINCEIPDWLITIIDRLLEKEADDRFQTAREVANLLSQYLAHVQQPVVVALPEPPPRSKRNNRRATGRPKWYVGGILLMVVLGFLGLSEATGVTQFAASVISIARGDGTLVVEVNDPEVSVAIEGRDVVITGAGPREVRLKPGDYRLLATKDGKPVTIDQELISIRRGGRQVAKITLKRHEPERAKGQPTKTASPRLIWADAEDIMEATPSPDGRYLSFVWVNDLAIRDLATENNRRLTSEGLEENGCASSSVFSPDGQQLAYKWDNYEKDSFELRVVDLNGSAPSVLQPEFFHENAQLLRPAGWSPDGKHVLALVRAENSLQIVFVPLEDGPVRILTTLARRSPGFWWLHEREFSASLSPNGRFVAYTFFPRDDSTARDIAVLAVDGSLERPLAEHAGDDFVLGWSRDGNRVVFASDRTGTMGIWTIDVAEGKPQTPKLVKADVGRDYRQIYALGMTPDGSLYYGMSSGNNHVYLADYDPLKGNITGEPTLVTQRRWGSSWAPAWSPDGRHLAWVSSGPFFNRKFTGYGNSGPYRFLILSADTREVRELSPDVHRLREKSLSWSPDGTALVGTRGGDGIVKVDVQTGEVTDIFGRVGLSPNWARDGTTIYDVLPGGRGISPHISRRDLTRSSSLPPRIVAKVFDVLDKDQDGRLTKNEFTEEMEEPLRAHTLRADGNLDGVVTRDELEKSKVMPGARETLYTATGYVSVVALSPDEKLLAFGEGDARTRAYVKVLSVDGGEPRELAEVDGVVTSIDWTPDGALVVYTLGGSRRAWRVPAKGGQAQMLDLKMDTDHVRFHPHGRKIAFVGKHEPGKSGVWVLENFLPRRTNIQENDNTTESDN